MLLVMPPLYRNAIPGKAAGLRRDQHLLTHGSHPSRIVRPTSSTLAVIVVFTIETSHHEVIHPILFRFPSRASKTGGRGRAAGPAKKGASSRGRVPFCPGISFWEERAACPRLIIANLVECDPAHAARRIRGVQKPFLCVRAVLADAGRAPECGHGGLGQHGRAPCPRSDPPQRCG